MDKMDRSLVKEKLIGSEARDTPRYVLSQPVKKNNQHELEVTITTTIGCWHNAWSDSYQYCISFECDKTDFGSLRLLYSYNFPK